jgi:hypothetical protein
VQSLYETYSTDKNIEAEIGIELDFGPSQFIVRRAGGNNKKYQTELRRVTNPIRRQIQNDTIAPETLDVLFKKVYARTVVIGWRGVTDREGNPLEFNEQNFIQLMEDLPDLWAQLQEECTKLANFRAEQNKANGEDLGN